MKQYKGKAIYNPSGKAGEYSYWACNFYTGCSNNCDYCYCKKGVMAHTWSETPKLKSCFKDRTHAIEVFKKELQKNLYELQEQGLFFTFTSDPFLDKTVLLNDSAIRVCLKNGIPVKILTKRAEFLSGYFTEIIFVDIIKSYSKYKNMIAFGFTLTGHDELEPNASPNAERIEAMKKLHDAGFKTWASIEPIIDVESSLLMIEESLGYCDHYKIGLMSGEKYNKLQLKIFVEKVICMKTNNSIPTLYFKDSLLLQAGINREDLPKNCVERDYNIF